MIYVCRVQICSRFSLYFAVSTTLLCVLRCFDYFALCTSLFRLLCSVYFAVSTTLLCVLRCFGYVALCTPLFRLLCSAYFAPIYSRNMKTCNMARHGCKRIVFNHVQPYTYSKNPKLPK